MGRGHGFSWFERPESRYGRGVPAPISRRTPLDWIAGGLTRVGSLRLSESTCSRRL
jgi:hypothetical protein